MRRDPDVSEDLPAKATTNSEPFDDNMKPQERGGESLTIEQIVNDILEARTKVVLENHISASVAGITVKDIETSDIMVKNHQLNASHMKQKGYEVTISDGTIVSLDADKPKEIKIGEQVFSGENAEKLHKAIANAVEGARKNDNKLSLEEAVKIEAIVKNGTGKTTDSVTCKQ